MMGHAGDASLGRRGEQVHVVAVVDEGPDEAQGRRLHAAVKDEGPGDDEELHAARSRVYCASSAAATHWPE